MWPPPLTKDMNSITTFITITSSFLSEHSDKRQKLLWRIIKVDIHWNSEKLVETSLFEIKTEVLVDMIECFLKQ